MASSYHSARPGIAPFQKIQSKSAMMKDAEETEIKLEPVDEEAEANWILQFFARREIQPECK